MTHDYQIDNIDMASYIEITTGRQAVVMRDLKSGRACFFFHNDEILNSAILTFASGEAIVKVQQFLAARRRLIHKVRCIVNGI